MKRLVEFILLPVLAFSSLVLLLHEYRPMLWRNCVRPAVFKMRSCRSYCYTTTRCMNKINSGIKSLICAFDKEIKTILRLIRLESEEVTEKRSRNKSTIEKMIKESTVQISYSLFYVY